MITKDYKSLQNAVLGWSTARGLDSANPVKQFFKLAEETGELVQAYVKDKREDLLDALGDIQVVLLILKQQLAHPDNKVINFDEKDDLLLNLLAEIGNMAIDLQYAKEYGKEVFIDEELKHMAVDLENFHTLNNTGEVATLELAWNEIKDRKGQMVNGSFVKEEDLA